MILFNLFSYEKLIIISPLWFQRDTLDIIEAIFQLTDAVVALFNESLVVYVRSLFSVLLTIQASPNLNSEFKVKKFVYDSKQRKIKKNFNIFC